ncbi:hypothetical protein GCM10009610_64450 [Pseudonocardia xinjiangensis]
MRCRGSGISATAICSGSRTNRDLGAGKDTQRRLTGSSPRSADWSAIEYSDTALAEAGAAYGRVESFLRRLVERHGTAPPDQALRREFVEAPNVPVRGCVRGGLRRSPSTCGDERTVDPRFTGALGSALSAIWQLSICSGAGRIGNP